MGAQYARAFWLGQGSIPPYHQLPAEYPSLAVVVFLTALAPDAYVQLVFGCWMGAAGMIGMFAIHRLYSRTAAFWYAAYITVGTGLIILSRFDLIPALLTLAALATLQRRRFALAHLLLGLGVLCKLYPALLIPVALIVQARVLAPDENGRVAAGGAPSRELGRAGVYARWLRVAAPQLAASAAVSLAASAAVSLGVVAAGFGVAFLLGHTRAFGAITCARHRPIEVESPFATILWIGTLFGVPAWPLFWFPSHNDVGPLDAVLLPFGSVALVGGLLYAYWRQLSGRLTLEQACVVCIGLAIVTNKVFSPQYLVWILPFVAVTLGFDVAWALICALMIVEYPLLSNFRYRYSPLFMSVVAVRNALLVVAVTRALGMLGAFGPAFRAPRRPRHGIAVNSSGTD